MLDRAIDEDLIARLHADAEERIGTIREEIERINEQLRASTDVLNVDLPPLPDPPAAHLPGGGLPPLISSCDAVGRADGPADRPQEVRAWLTIPGIASDALAIRPGSPIPVPPWQQGSGRDPARHALEGDGPARPHDPARARGARLTKLITESA